MTSTVPRTSNSTVYEKDYTMRLTPSGILHLDKVSEVKDDQYLSNLQKKIAKDWREGWFFLAADKKNVDQQPSLRFWQDVAKEYITVLCHLPEEEDFSPLQAPGAAQLYEFILRAPPFIGGEYLTVSRLEGMWNELNLWAESAAKSKNGIHTLLSEYAPKWQQVGRVCFHLAENKKDQERPFAFLATYSTGFGVTGKLKHLPLKKALEQYSGSNNRQTLVKLLTPINNATECCPWVQDLVSTGEIYQPLAWSVDKAHKLLCSVPNLEESGLSVRIPNWWIKRSRPQVSVTIGSKKQAALGVNAMLDFKIEVALGEYSLTEDELEEISSAKGSLAFVRGQWVEIDNEKLQDALDHWKTVQKHAKNGEISFIDGMRLLAGAPTSLQDEEFIEKQYSWVNISAGDALSNILKQIRDPSLIPEEKALENVKATLRPYQREGVNWLSLLSGLGLGACLADDMGLGKTLQILSLLMIDKTRSVKAQKKPSLLVVPASLLGNWKRESERFTPSLNLLFIHPSETEQKKLTGIAENPEKHLEDIDLVITTYSMVSRHTWLSEIKWNQLILDEAQAIKNAGTKQSRATKKLNSHSKIALTGTPIENRLSDLWSLFDFLNPGLLGTSSRFSDYIKGLEEGRGQFDTLRKLVAPYILRRMKTDPKIISDLPEKIETQSYCQLTKEQAQYYQSAVNDLKHALNTVDPKSRRGVVLQTLTRLKQICNHPSHFNGEQEYQASLSGKFMRLGEICEELASRQEKVLVFTQFSEIIEPLSQYLSEIYGRQGLILHGGTPIKKRKHLVEEFQSEDGPPYFVLSLKAGGTGLTLTAASHVIHFDRWWNPAVEDQATDRAFRIGQKKNVQVHKFITQGTLEEEIDKIISSKKQLSKEILSGGEEIKVTELSDNELIDLVSLDIDKVRRK